MQLLIVSPFGVVERHRNDLQHLHNAAIEAHPAVEQDAQRAPAPVQYRQKNGQVPTVLPKRLGRRVEEAGRSPPEDAEGVVPAAGEIEWTSSQVMSSRDGAWTGDSRSVIPVKKARELLWIALDGLLHVQRAIMIQLVEARPRGTRPDRPHAWNDVNNSQNTDLIAILTAVSLSLHGRVTELEKMLKISANEEIDDK